MGELTATVLRFGFLLLLWIMIIAVLTAVRRDLAVGRKNRTSAARNVSTGAATPDAPTAAARPHARRLVVLEGPQQGTVIDLGGSPVMMGRAEESTLVLEDDYASGRHARLFPQGSRWFLEDLGSTNGSYVDGQRIQGRAQLVDGSVITMGRTRLVFRLLVPKERR